MSAKAVTPRAEAEGSAPTQAGCPGPSQSGAQAGLNGLDRVTQSILLPNWHETPRKRHYLLTKLGICHILIALVHLAIGLYLSFEVKNLHLVTLRSWYPFWGAACFFISGGLAIILEQVHKTYMLVNLVTSTISFLCALAGLVVIAKDLFLESPFLFPIWMPYPNSTVHIQRLELALFCFVVLELFLPGALAIIACKEYRRADDDNVSLILDVPLEPKRLSPSAPPMYLSPPPSYEEVIGARSEDPEVKDSGTLSPVCTVPAGTQTNHVQQ